MFKSIGRLLAMLRSTFFYFRDRRRRQLKMVQEYHERLRTIIMELLSQADELDQQSKYLGIPSESWAQELRSACSELVKLGDDLPHIERMLDENDLKRARDLVFDSCQKATQISRQLESIRRDENGRRSK